MVKNKKDWLPPGKTLLQLYRITRQRIQTRSIRMDETYDQIIDRLLTQYEARNTIAV